MLCDLQSLRKEEYQMENMELNEEGFITNFLVSGPKETLVEDDTKDNNQLRYETYLRSVIVDAKESISQDGIKIGGMSELDMPWEYYYSHGNWFVDKSNFYPLLRKIEMFAATNLISNCTQKVSAIIWTYGAVEVWVNNVLQGEAKTPVYKPIVKKEMELTLEKGKNEVFIRFQNLGVRDTRNIFGIQLLDHNNSVQVSLPDEEKAKRFYKLQEILDSCILSKDKLSFIRPHDGIMTLRYDNKTDDYFKQSSRFEDFDITGEKEVQIKEGERYLSVIGTIDEFSLQRKLEIAENTKPTYISYQEEDSKTFVYQEISKVGAMLRGSTDRFSMYNLLARRALGKVEENEEEEILNDLKHMENRRDCSDFILCAYLRYLQLYPISQTLEKRTKEVLLNYRYWMDQEGFDGMCFWSENHSLLFYLGAFMAGQRYPKDTFVRSGKIGEELAKEAYQKINEWLEDVLERGFEEFQSGGYTPITFSGLLNLVDFEKGELSKKATLVLNKMMEMLVVHTFKGCVISPQGRVYREVLFPCSQSTQVLIHMLDSTTPYYFSEWVSMLASSSYEFPAHLRTLINKEVDCEYSTGNALVKVYKTKDYIVTSVQSKREDENPNYWDNIIFEKDADVSSTLYCKSLNECFHGTTRFEPGVYGYQQHMCYVGVDNDTVVFVNHPGGTLDATSMRPGYWFGNGIMPAIKQEKEMFGVIYDISKDHPISFTHMYFPVNKFDQVVDDGLWKFARKGDGYVAVWSSSEMKPYNDQLFDCEFRINSRQVSYLFIAGSKEEYVEFNHFIKDCKARNPKFQKEMKTLCCDNFSMEFKACFNKTQFV